MGGGGIGAGECDVNPLHVSGGLKEGRIRLVGECNQCDYITEYDERGGAGRCERQDVGRQKLFRDCAENAKGGGNP